MATRIKRIREQQLLSPEFIAKQLSISLDEYRDIEFSDFNNLDSKLQNKLCILFGVEAVDLVEKSRSDINVDTLGFARSFSYINDKDKHEIKKILTFKKKYIEEMC